MSNQKILLQESNSVRKLPANFAPADLRIFEHELKREIPATVLSSLKNITVNSDGILSRKRQILSASFPSPDSPARKLKLKASVQNLLYGFHQRIEQETFWITDIWSISYFHWMTDALPRLFVIREEIANATLLLPNEYRTKEYIKSSLKPFFIPDLKFVHRTICCRNLKIPTHTAVPTGNYNESIIRALRSLYRNFYQKTQYSNCAESRIYISRSKAQRRKIINEKECIVVLEKYGFKTVCFEDYSFEQQAKFALNAQYLISNHGAGMTNMLFMKSGSKVFELRKQEDIDNNCYFTLASALHLEYFYQLCDSENCNNDSHLANLIVDCQLLKKNIEYMLIG
jgi:hypothetical protein